MLVNKFLIFAQTITFSVRNQCKIITPRSLSTLLSNKEFSRVNFTYISILPKNNHFVAQFSDKSNDSVDIMTTTYDVVKDLPNRHGIYLIDVREPDEIKETGQIPTSINIPLGEVSTVLSDSTSNDVFKKRFGKDKPNSSTPIIFYCRSGVRSQKASLSAVALEYKNVQNYVGSWLDWSEKEGLPK